MSNIFGRRAAAVVACALLAAGQARAEVDFGTAVPALIKILAYDVNFDARGVGPFTVLVVSEPGQAKGRAELLAALKALTALKVKARPVAWVSWEYKDEAGLQAEIDKARAAALLVVPGMALPTVKAVWDVAQDNQLYALALEAQTVEQLLPVGVTMAGDKPQIIINEKSAKAVGVRFDTAVLRVARVVQ